MVKFEVHTITVRTLGTSNVWSVHAIASRNVVNYTCTINSIIVIGYTVSRAHVQPSVPLVGTFESFARI